MKSALASLATIVLFASPAVAGGNWNDWNDPPYWGGGYPEYYEGPPAYYAGLYPPRYAAPRYYMPRRVDIPAEAPADVPRYDVPPYGAYPYSAGRERFYAGNCEIKRKWRRGRYYEKIECDD